jgi:hypothetical protein
VLVYVGFPSAAALIGGSLLFERRSGLLPALGALLPARGGAFLKAGLMSAAVNLASYWAISSTSSLTFKVCGCLKNLGVVGYGVAVHGDRVSSRHLLGYGVSMAGFVFYSYTRQQAAVAAGAQKQAAAAAAVRKRKGV